MCFPKRDIVLALQLFAPHTGIEVWITYTDDSSIAVGLFDFPCLPQYKHVVRDGPGGLSRYVSVGHLQGRQRVWGAMANAHNLRIGNAKK